MHIPLFLKTVEDEDSYFVIHHEERLSILRRLAAAGIEKVFSGHYHRNAGGMWSCISEDGKRSTVNIDFRAAFGFSLHM